MLSFKYRIYPTKSQQIFFEKSFGCNRFIWNKAVEINKQSYEADKKFVFYNGLAKKLIEFKNEKELDWLKEVNSQPLQQTLRRFETTLKQCFKKKSKGGFPKFKSKKSTLNQSLLFPQHFKIKDNWITLPKLKDPLKFVKHREYRGKVKQVTVKKEIDQWFVIFSCVTAYPKFKESDNVGGIDLGIKSYVTLSDGSKIDQLQTPIQEKRLKIAQRKLSKKQKGSNNRFKQRIKVAKIYEKIKRKRKDFKHKLSNSIVKNFDIIAMENLNIKGMLKNKNLAPSISKLGWHDFAQMLDYKLKLKGGKLIKIDRFFPSTKTCSNCGWIKEDLSLKDRKWKCDCCHSELDRDFNASMNILNEGIRLIRLEQSDSKPVEIRTPERKLKNRNQVRSKKQEAIEALASW